MRVFFGGPLTELKDPQKIKAFYKKLAEAAVASGCEYYWAFLRGTDPEENPTIPPSRVYQIDTYELEKSDLMIAYVGEPSTGTGVEIEYARHHNIPVYVLYEKGKRISRMLRGSPIVKGEIVFSDGKDAYAQVASLLKSLKK